MTEYTISTPVWVYSPPCLDEGVISGVEPHCGFARVQTARENRLTDDNQIYRRPEDRDKLISQMDDDACMLARTVFRLQEESW